MKIINLFGGPGSGKSTTAAGLFYMMKIKGYNVELVMEYAKQLLFEGRLEDMLDRQEYIYAKQHAKLQDLMGKVDWVVTDSPILLSAAYPEINRHLDKAGRLQPWPQLPTFQHLVRTQFDFYDNYNFWLQRPDTYQKEGRLQDEEEAKWIDNRLLEELKGRDLKIVEVDDYTLTTILKVLYLD